MSHPSHLHPVEIASSNKSEEQNVCIAGFSARVRFFSDKMFLVMRGLSPIAVSLNKENVDITEQITAILQGETVDSMYSVICNQGTYSLVKLIEE